MESLICSFLDLPVISSLLGRHVLFSTLISQNLWASLKLTDHIQNMDVSMMITYVVFR
jgi:hypothetical protein